MPCAQASSEEESVAESDEEGSDFEEEEPEEAGKDWDVRGVHCLDARCAVC